MLRIRLEGLALPVVVMALTGCDFMSTRFVSGLSAEDRAQAAQIPVYRERLSEGSYQSIAPVEGLSCEVSHDDIYRASENNAIEELQRATFKTGGNAVMEVVCNHFDRHQRKRNCFRSIVCRGIAVQTTAGTGR